MMSLSVAMTEDGRIRDLSFNADGSPAVNYRCDSEEFFRAVAIIVDRGFYSFEWVKKVLRDMHSRYEKDRSVFSDSPVFDLDRAVARYKPLFTGSPGTPRVGAHEEFTHHDGVYPEDFFNALVVLGNLDYLIPEDELAIISNFLGRFGCNSRFFSRSLSLKISVDPKGGAVWRRRIDGFHPLPLMYSDHFRFDRFAVNDDMKTIWK